jgi:hypothetical protein
MQRGAMTWEPVFAPHATRRDSLRSGKRLLKEKNGAAALVRFEKALMLSKVLSDKVILGDLDDLSGTSGCCDPQSLVLR